MIAWARKIRRWIQIGRELEAVELASYVWERERHVKRLEVSSTDKREPVSFTWPTDLHGAAGDALQVEVLLQIDDDAPVLCRLIPYKTLARINSARR